MSNPTLTKAQRDSLFIPLFEQIQADLERLSGGDPRLLWAMRRKLAKELTYLERGTPMERTKLKAIKWKEQGGLCALCGSDMPQSGSELDRTEAYLGYVSSNVRLVHHECHVQDQASKGFA
jgi:hypothetical protein